VLTEAPSEEAFAAREDMIVRYAMPSGVDRVPSSCPVKPGTTVMACGIELRTGKPGDFWTMRENGRHCGFHVANAQMSPVFPADLVGLDQEGTEIFEVLRNTANCFCVYGMMHGHNILPVVLARLGMAERLRDELWAWAEQYQLFPQGLFCYFNRHRDYPSQHTGYELTNPVVALETEDEKTEVPQGAFSHMALEAGSVLEAAIDEMLLQSHSGHLRVLPAIPDDWEGRFKLHAVGGFVVTAERKAGRTLYVAIESTRGGACRLVNPWPGEPVRVRDHADADKPLVEGTDEKLRFETRAGHVYLVDRPDFPIEGYRQETISGQPNDQPKIRGLARLGRPRMG
jgi:hypothetical protein